MSLTNPISFIVENQLPEFIRSDLTGKYDNFVAFVKAYYEWLEQENGITAETRSLLSYADIDKTTEEFIDHFTNKFLPYFPKDLINDKAKLVKTIHSFYAKKGSIESLKFLFRVLYNEDIEIYLPKENILRASDGKWRVPRTLRLTVENTPASFDLNRLKKRLAVGRTSRALCVIESAYRTIDVGTGAEIIEIYVSNVRKTFSNGELLDVQYIDDDGNEGILITERIIGSLSNIRINSRNRGLRYKTGDPVVLVGGLSTDPGVPRLEARAIVNETTDGRIQTVSVGYGGFGFRTFANTEVDVINAPEDITGSGAIIKVTEIGTGVAFSYNRDPISPYSAIQLNAADYGMPKQAGLSSTTTINTTLADAFLTASVTLGPISKVEITSPGTKYTEVPTLDVNSYYDTTESENYYNEVVGNLDNSYRDDWEASRQKFLDLGKIASVEIISGGSGYDASTDRIYVNRNGGGGYAAQITFTTTSGVITGVSLVNGGEGYHGPKGSVELIVANKDNRYLPSAGNGAVLRAYRYGEGDEIDSTVEDVGRIKNFKLLSRGSGYVSTPTVSLKVKDLSIAELSGEPIQAFQEGQFIYQGSESSPTFRANVDLYLNETGTLRVYNYNGTLNTALNLIISATSSTTKYNVNVYSQVTYGNGLARANAEFLNGLINYDGYYLNTDGFLSADKKLQDSRRYHNFSYVVATEKSLKDYRGMLLDLVHPTGTKMFGTKHKKDIIATGFGFS
jgi:hypothetical protein